MLAGESPAAGGLVVTTPEQVSFAYEVAGLGSRFLAQLVDLLVWLGLGLVVVLLMVLLAFLTHDPAVVLIVGLTLSFVLFFGYFPVAELLTSGQTLGKRLLRLRVVGDRGEPITVSQAAIRNLVRIVDFLPFLYGIGVVAIFAGTRGKRLGDYAAGTVVVRERQRVGLGDLLRMTQQPAAAVLPEVALPDDNYTRAARRAGPELRRYVMAYAPRRHRLPPWRRQQLADQVAPALYALLPAEVAYYGTLLALDALADRVR